MAQGRLAPVQTLVQDPATDVKTLTWNYPDSSRPRRSGPDKAGDSAWQRPEQARKRAVEPLSAEVLDKHSPHFRQAAEALAEVDYTVAKDVLQEAAVEEGREYPRSHFLRVAKEPPSQLLHGWPQELADIVQLARDARTLTGEQYGEEEIGRLLNHIDSPYVQVRGECLASLGHMRAASAVPALVEMNERHPERGATLYLAQIGTPEAVRYLAASALSPDLTRRKAAVSSLAWAGRWGVPLLIQLLDDADLRVTTSAPEEIPPWPDEHLAHVSLFQCLWRAGLHGESKNLAEGGNLNVDEEIAGLKKWWATHREDFLRGLPVPTPEISSVFDES